MIYAVRPFVTEMRWAFSWEAIAVGVLIFAIWVGLDRFYPHLLTKGVKIHFHIITAMRPWRGSFAQFTSWE